MNNKVSIITVVYNQRDNIKATLENLAPQVNKDVDLLIVDGESDDGTIDVVTQFESPYISMISEPDDGIFDAMNKGILLTKGDWLIFINAGDLLIPGVLDKLNLDECHEFAVVYGNTIRQGGRVDTPFERKLIRYGAMPMCHQSMLYNRQVLGKQLYYDTTFKLFGENELLMRIYKFGFSMKYVNVAISRFQGGGVSARIDNKVRLARYYYLYKYFGLNGIFSGLAHKLRLTDIAKV